MHAFIRSIDHVSSGSRRICILELDESSGAKLHRFDDVFENWVTSAWCVFRAYGFSFRQLFSPFRSSFFFFFISSARTDRILLGRRIFLLRWPRHEYTKLLRETFSLIATASLSPCYIRGLPFSQGFCNLNIQTCLAPIFVSLVSIFIYRVLITDPFHSSLLPSTFQFLHSPPGFTFYVSFRCFSFPLLFLPVFLFKQKEGRKKKSRIPGQRFQGSVTSLTNWLPRIQPSLPRSCCSTDRAAILRRFAYPSRLVEKRHQESSLESA